MPPILFPSYCLGLSQPFAAEFGKSGDDKLKFLTANDRYIARRIAIPLLATLVIAAMLLVLDQMLRLFDFVAAEGGPVQVVFRMLANLLPEYFSVAIPLALMLGILMAFRGLATTSELDVMRAVGISYRRLLRVPYFYALGLIAVNVAIVGYLQPYALYYYEQLQYDLRSGALGASIKVGQFNKLGDGITLRVEQSQDNGTDLSGIFVDVGTKQGEHFTATAQSGQFLSTDDPNLLLLRLRDGTAIQQSPKFEGTRVLTFSLQDLPIDLPEMDRFRMRGGVKDQENTFFELLSVARNPSFSVETRNAAWANFNFRAVELAVMLLIPLLALALAVPPKRSTSALGIVFSVILLVTYHKVNEFGEGVAALGRTSPFVSLWLPFFAFAALIIWMYYVLAYVPGGQPIGAIEKRVDKFAKWLRRRFRIGRSRSEHTEPTTP